MYNKKANMETKFMLFKSLFVLLKYMKMDSKTFR